MDIKEMIELFERAERTEASNCEDLHTLMNKMSVSEKEIFDIIKSAPRRYIKVCRRRPLRDFLD